MSNVVTISSPIYYAFDPETHGNYILGIEKLSKMLPELRKNADAHWEETETLYRQAFGDPNYRAYMQLEDEGKFAVFTAREKDSLDMVGHIAFYVYESMHTVGVMEAREDAFFIQKEHRGGRLALRLYDYAEQVFKQMGVSQISMSCKAPAGGPDLDKFLRRKGFKPVATSYFKPLEVDSDGNV